MQPEPGPTPITMPWSDQREGQGGLSYAKDRHHSEAQTVSMEGYYPDMLKTKQNEHQQTNKNSTLLKRLLPLSAKELVCDQQRRALLTPVSSQGSHSSQMLSPCGSIHISQEVCSVKTHCPVSRAAQLSPGRVNSLPGRGQLPEDNAFRDQRGFEAPVTLRTFILKGFHIYLEKSLLICHTEWSVCGPCIT